MALMDLSAECPIEICGEAGFVNSWSFENVAVGAAYLDSARRIRINPRLLLLQPGVVEDALQAVAADIGKRWSVDEIHETVRAGHQRLRTHFDVVQVAFGIVVRLSKPNRHRLVKHPSALAEFRVSNDKMDDLVVCGVWDRDDVRDRVIEEGMAAIADLFLVEFDSSAE